VDVYRVLEFLTHPYGPFSRRARRILARAFAEQPGYGGAAWHAARDEIQALDGGDALLPHLDFWFGEERWTREDGAPLVAVEERVDRVLGAMRVLMDNPRADVLSVVAGIRQAQALLAALTELKSQDLARLTPRHLEHMLAEATMGGAGNPYAEAQVGCRRSTTTSALAALEPVDEVLWWMPSRPVLPPSPPWSGAEITALRDAGAEIRDTAVELRALARDWLRPLLGARQRFTLVLPPASEEEHPVALLVRQVLPHLPVRRVEEELAASSDSQVVSNRPLPGPQRSFQIAADMSSRRERQSFTSLTDLFNHPAVSVLKDAAALRGVTLMAVQDERRLFGTLAHRLVENLFANADALTWDTAQVRKWFDGVADDLVAAEGAPLLMQGLGVVLHRFKSIVREGTVALLAHLRAAGVVRVRTELDLQGTLFDVPITGKVDLLAELPGERQAILDLKWSGTGRYRERLETGTHLQLAIYATLVEQSLKQAPVELGFFIFEGRTLLTTSDRYFATALACVLPPECSVSDLIARARASWRWRHAQLAAGQLESVDTRLDALEAFQGPPGTLPVQLTGPWNDEYVALLGWEAGL